MEKNIEFVRVDDRLIHGQVCTAWLHAYSNVTHVLVVDDKTAEDPFMQTMFELLIPKGISIEIKNIKDAITEIKAGLPKPTMMIVKTPATIKALIDGGVDISFFNIGGMGMTGKRYKFYRNISADDEERALLKELVNKGIKIEIQIIPAQENFDVSKLL